MNGKCVICNLEGKVVAHHVCYFPELKQQLCVKCHRKIHGDGSTALSAEFKQFKKTSGQMVFVSDECWEFLRELSFKRRIPMSVLASKILLDKKAKEESK
jgi:hypothetical protein